MATEINGLGQARSSINVTPLVDVLLVLLIIFIMVAPVLTKAMESNIPQKVDHPLPSDYAEQLLVVAVRSDGQLFLNRERLAASDLPARLRDLFAQRGGRRLLFVDADPATAYGTVVAVMDLCRDGGAETIGIIPDSTLTPIP